MHVEADPVAHPVLEGLSVARRLDRLAAGAVDLAGEDAGTQRPSARFLRRQDEVVRRPHLRVRLADADRAAEVGAVAVDDRPEVEHDHIALLDRLRAARLGGVLAADEAREDVRREGGDARAVQAHLVLDLLGELEHGRARLHLRRDRRDRPVADVAGALHHRELVGRLRPAQLVDEPRHGHDALGRERVRQVDHRLAPGAVADPEGARLAEAARRPREQRRAVVPLAHDDHLARQLTGQLEEAHHPRQHEDRLTLGRDERAGHPAVCVLGLAERRDRALDAGEVLEIRRRRDEDEVDALLLHALGEPAPPFGVVEHDVRL